MSEQWQKIETAPKDGTAVLAWDGYDMAVTQWGESSVYARADDWVVGPTQDDRNTRSTFEPTHWMPLPAPPRSPSDEEQKD